VHEYSFAAELDPAWAAKPLALTRHEGRTILVLKDPGGQPLDRILERDQGQPLDLTHFLNAAIGLARTLGQRRELRAIFGAACPNGSPRDALMTSLLALMTLRIAS
jgi:hypothetical protein